MSARDGADGGSSTDSQRFSLFHGGAEPGFRAWHAPYADVFGGRGRVADVGCGPGYFLDLVRERGGTGFGIDLDPDMVAAAQRRGHEAVLGGHRTLAEMPSAFSGVHLSHIIEHLWGDEAVELLEAAKTALQPQGVLIVRTPNWGNATVRHGGFWLDHTHKRPYPRELLEKLLADLDFEILQAGYEPGGWEDTFVIARKRGSTLAPAPAPAVTAVLPPQSPTVTAPAVGTRMMWRGDFLNEHSFARVNRELAREIHATRKVEVIPQGEPVEEVERILGAVARRAEQAPPATALFTLQHQWPPRFRAPHQGYSIHIQPFEFGAIPRTWGERARRLVDDVWCPSQYVRDMYVAAGVPVERTFVLPWGVDPTIFNLDAPRYDIGNDRTFVFLFVGGTIWRKGIDILIDAYLAEFAPTDEVVLIVKSFGSSTFYSNQNSTGRIAELAKRNDVPLVRITEETVNDTTMASLYRRADAFVAPYRGEGFGMPILEAMACGAPPIVPIGGATDDFVTEAVGYRIPAARVGHGMTVDGDALGAPGWVLQVDQATLQRAMRHVFDHRDEAHARGAAAAALVHERYTWAHSARRAIARLDELKTRTPLARADTFESINAFEAKVHSQNGEDGILRELFSRLRVANPFFVEFGAEAGVECNTAMLARSCGWSGLLIEGGSESYAHLRANYAAFPKVQTRQAMVDRDNIAAIFAEHRVPLDLDLLSIDVDGNDYYLWEALAAYRARVVVIEINPAYPPPQRWVMAYNPDHTWKHNDYYGASLASLTALGNRLGYALLGIDTNAVNAFFLRRDLLDIAGFPERTAEQVYHPPSFRQPHFDGPSVAL